MNIKYEVESDISATILHVAHPLLGFEAITQIEFFSLDMTPMKQVLLVPYDMSVPQNLHNENVVTYRVPPDYIFYRLVFGQGHIAGQPTITVKIFYTTGEEKRHHGHTLVD